MGNFGIATGAFVDERDDWEAAVARAAAEGWRVVELTAIFEDRLDSLFGFLTTSRHALAAFERVSIHAPIVLRTSAPAVAETLAALGREFDVILHPDVYGEQSVLRGLGSRAVFENMDAAKSFGRDVRSMRAVFDTFPEAGLCLDVAHVWTNDRSLGLAFDLLDELGERLRQLHVSGIEPDGTHRPTTRDDLTRYQPVLDRCLHVPWLLEAELTSAAAR